MSNPLRKADNYYFRRVICTVEPRFVTSKHVQPYNQVDLASLVHISPQDYQCLWTSSLHQNHTNQICIIISDFTHQLGAASKVLKLPALA